MKRGSLLELRDTEWEKGGEDICYVRAEMSVPEGRFRVRVRGGLVVMRLHCYK